MKQLRNATIESLHKTRSLLDSLARTPSGPQLYGNTDIGRHVRHIIDHFQVFRDGLEGGYIDYNRRNRDSAMESDIDEAGKAIADLMQWAETDRCLDEDQAVVICSELSCHETVSTRIDSSLRRELHYVAYHCIHHLAYCVLLASQNGIEIDPAIGMAPATASYLRAVSG